MIGYRRKRTFFAVVFLLFSTRQVRGESNFPSGSDGASFPRQFSVSPHSHNGLPNSITKFNHPGLRKRPWGKLSVPTWLRLPSRESLAELKNPKLLSRLASACQVGIIAFLVMEIFRAFREVQREFKVEASKVLDGSGDPETGSLFGSPVLLPGDARQLVAWLNEPYLYPGHPPESVPSWMVDLAQDLRSTSMDDMDLYRTLNQLTKPQAQMLQSCLLRRSSETIDFDALPDNDLQNREILNLLRLNGMTVDPPEPNEATASYLKLLRQGRQGIALFGPPGCGKSMKIKAIAADVNVPVIVITPSLLQRKWFGESTNQVRTLFGLISSLGSCVVVWDELDGLFRSRSQEEHDATRELKTELLQWWDGVMSDQGNDHQVLMLGATNRPWDVDPAVWRRLPLRYYVGFPSWDTRHTLFMNWLSQYKIPVDEGDKDDIRCILADHTQGYTISDLLQVLQTACQEGPLSRSPVDALNVEDVRNALQVARPTIFSQDYLVRLQSFLSPQDQATVQQPPGTMVMDGRSRGSDPSHVWRTPMGNFYQFNIPVEPQVFDALNEIWLISQEWESSSDDGDYSDEDDFDSDIDPDTDNLD